MIQGAHQENCFRNSILVGEYQTNSKSFLKKVVSSCEKNAYAVFFTCIFLQVGLTLPPQKEPSTHSQHFPRQFLNYTCTGLFVSNFAQTKGV